MEPIKLYGPCPPLNGLLLMRSCAERRRTMQFNKRPKRPKAAAINASVAAAIALTAGATIEGLGPGPAHAQSAMPRAAMPAAAEDEYNVSNGYTLDGAQLALHGFDTVALSTLNAVAHGAATQTVVHDGVASYFASPLSAEMFKADPEKYMPQYGGFCAFAMALGKKLDGDPRFADIVDGKLYLFVNAAIFERYKADRERTLRRAEEAWPGIHHTTVDSL